jgi:uncharacterized membrane protein YkvA (DUF1232 family)
VPDYARLAAALLRDDRIPAGRKALLAGAAGYLLLGRDLVPDRIPLLGALDDLIVVGLAVDLFIDGVPEGVVDEKLDELGLDRASFERDLAQLRRLTPSPVRRTTRRLAAALEMGGRTWRESGFGPWLRTRHKEDQFA